MKTSSEFDLSRQARSLKKVRFIEPAPGTISILDLVGPKSEGYKGLSCRIEDARINDKRFPRSNFGLRGGIFVADVRRLPAEGLGDLCYDDVMTLCINDAKKWRPIETRMGIWMCLLGRLDFCKGKIDLVFPETQNRLFLDESSKSQPRMVQASFHHDQWHFSLPFADHPDSYHGKGVIILRQEQGTDEAAVADFQLI